MTNEESSRPAGGDYSNTTAAQGTGSTPPARLPDDHFSNRAMWIMDVADTATKARLCRGLTCKHRTLTVGDQRDHHRACPLYGQLNAVRATAHEVVCAMLGGLPDSADTAERTDLLFRALVGLLVARAE